MDIATDTALVMTVVMTCHGARTSSHGMHAAPPHPEARTSMEREVPGGVSIGKVLLVLSFRYLRF